MFALFFLVFTALTFGAPPIEVSREAGIPYYFFPMRNCYGFTLSRSFRRAKYPARKR